MPLYAQQTVKGRVVDAQQNQPVIGAAIKIKGVTGGTQTDTNGNFQLKAEAGAVLEITYVGYLRKEIAAAFSGVMEIVLIEDNKMLDDVVVVGYGTQKKETLTGSVSVVGKEIFQDKGTVANPLQAMQGQVPGLRITRSSSTPGEEGWNVSVRGAVSKNNIEPLVIIDGVPADGTGVLAQINSSDIESINVLKDASAAIYGAKAAGGVILVTTKKPSLGKLKIDYNGSFTYKKVGLQPRLMSMDQWIDGIIQARYNDGYGEDDTWVRYARLAKANKGSYIDLTDGKNPDPIPGRFGGVADFVFHDVNWTDALWGGAGSTQHDLSLSGGNEKSGYRLSLGYLKDNGTLKWGNNSNERYNLRLSNNFKLSERISVESVISSSRQNQISPTMIGNALTVSTPQPGLPVSTIDGKAYAWGGQYTPNWLAELGGDNKLLVTTFTANETFKYQMLKDFNLITTLGYSTAYATRDEQFLSIDWYSYNGKAIVGDNSPYPTKASSSYTKSNARTDNYTIASYMNYMKTIQSDHKINLMVGTQYDRKAYDFNATRAKDINSSLDVLNGSGEITINGVQRYQEALMSYFSRANYDYKSKYLLEANARYDGSSKFQPKNRWSFFYGVSGGWRITKESFMENAKKFLDELKLRVSYGEVGNQSGIGRFDGIQLYDFRSGGGAYIGDGSISYISAVNELVSTQRTWERIKNYNLGIDFGIFGRRLSGSFDIFLKRNDNMLVGVLMPGVLGGNAPQTNNGKFESKGMDWSLSWREKIGELSYHLGATYTYMENKLISGGNNVIADGLNQTVNGYALNSVFGYRYVGKIQNQEQLKKYTNRYLGSNSIGMPAAIRLGDHMYNDENGDGKLNQSDLVYLGTDDPKASFSLNLGLEWKNFDFSAIFQGVSKRTVYRTLDSWKVPFKAIWLNTSDQSVGNVWSPETPGNRFPSYSNNTITNNYNYIPSSWSVEDGTYLRLKNIVLGYNFSQLAFKKLFSNIRVYVAGADLWEISKINDGWDPEATRNVDKKERYPFNRTITAGLNATF